MFYSIWGLIPGSYQDMVLVDQCTGLRAGELLGLQWEAIDFERLCMKVKEVVSGRIGPLKTEYSDDELTLDPDFSSLGSNRSRTGPVCCSRVPSPAVLTMLPRSSRTISVARDGVLLHVLAVVRLRERHAPRWIRSGESGIPSRSMMNVASLQPRTVSAASDGTLFGTPTGPCSAVRIPRWTFSKN